MTMGPNPVSDMNQGRPIQKLQLAAVSRDSVQTLINSSVIQHDGFPAVRVTTGGAVTGIILQAGLYRDQILIVQNESANTITGAAASTSLVLAGTSWVVAANSLSILRWEQALSRWVGAI